MNNLKLPLNMYDPTRDHENHKNEYNSAINNVLQHGIYINGPEVKQLEKQLASYIGVKHCITVGNGTDALQIALLALDVKPGDEVITVAHTWISTAEVISIINAIPVFVDIENTTFNIDISKIEEKITSKTKAIMPVSLYGHMPNYDSINKLAKKYNLPVIEDGAQSFGASLNGKKSCSMTTIGCTSFFPSKPLGCYGDGGACFTNDDELAVKIRAIKNHGGTKRFHHTYIGMNSRLDTLQASVLLVKFKNFEICLKNRNYSANFYNTNLKELDTNEIIKLPKILDNYEHAWAQYAIIMPNKTIRDNAVEKLKENGINVSIFYPVPLYHQECFKYLGYDIGALLTTEYVCNTVINLPCYGEQTKEELKYITDTFKSVVYSLVK